MLDSHYPTASELLAQQRLRRNAVAMVFTATLTIIFGIMVALTFISPKTSPATLVGLGSVMIGLLAFPVLIWNYPRAGLFILFGATTIFDMDPRTLNTHRPTCLVPFFLNLNNVGDIYHTGALAPLKFSIAEVIIVTSLVAWIIRSIVKRDLHLHAGPFLGCLLFYATTTMIGYVHGYATGADPTMALWEVRAQFYPLIMYFLTLNMITDREQVQKLLWVGIIGIGILGLTGIQSYLVLGGNVTDQGILDHEDSLILNVFVFLWMMMMMNRANLKMNRVALLLLPAVSFSILENQRRAGIAAFIIAFIIFLPIAYVMFVERRKQVTAFIVAFGVLSAIYLPIAWNANGAWALPARAIRSNSSPDERDAGSDQYRQTEDYDLKVTRDMSPFIGYGYGKPFIEAVPLPAVTTGFLQYFAHDSVLWVWMRTGHLGFFAFILFIATVLIKGLQICRQTRDPILLTAGIMCILFIVMAYVYGKYDLQLTNYRTMMMLGIWLGILGALPRLTKAQEAAAADQEPERIPFVEFPGMLEGEVL